jgi:hypothetical protein
MSKLKNLLATLKRQVLTEQGGMHPAPEIGQVVDVTLARAPEQNYATQWRKWKPAGKPTKDSEFVQGPGLYEGWRPDVERALFQLVHELDAKYPMRRRGEEEPPEHLKDAMKRTSEVVMGLKLPDDVKQGMMMQLKKHDYVRGWDSYSDQKGLMQHLAQMALKFGTGGADPSEEIHEVLTKLKKVLNEH